MHYLRCIGGLISGLIILSAAPRGKSDVLQLNPIADTSLFGTQPDNNLGASTNLIMGTTAGGGRNRALIQFDLSTIPRGSTLNSVTLVLTDVSTSGSFSNAGFQLHRMISEWREGAGTGQQGRAAVTPESTWNSQFHGVVPWSTPGAVAGTDYRTNVSGFATVSTNSGRLTWGSSTSLVADVRFWIDNADQNFGWIIIGANESALETARRVGSRENTSGRAPVLQIDYTPRVELTPAADTGLFEYNPDNNLGGLLFMPVGRTKQGNRARGLLRFDIAGALPANAIITTASLNLRVVQSLSSSNTVLRLHRVTQPWNEGTKNGVIAGLGVGAPASDGEATWNSRLHNVSLWNSPGGAEGADYLPAASGSRTVAGNVAGGYDFTSPAMLADLQTWLNLPGTNFGWMLIDQYEDTSSGARRIASREDPANSPRLTLTYTVPGSNEPPVLRLVGLTNQEFVLSFLAEAGKTYTLERRPDLDASSWLAFSNIGPLLVVTNATAADALGTSNSFYRLRRNP